MKLNHECVRDCLLWLEDNLGLTQTIDSKDVINNLDYSEDDVFYTLQKLNEIGYIVGGVNIQYAAKGNGLIHLSQINDITWDGHEYLDTIRDSKIWSKTKEASSSLKSVSLSMMKTIATQVLTGYIKQKTGLPL